MFLSALMIRAQSIVHTDCNINLIPGLEMIFEDNTLQVARF